MDVTDFVTPGNDEPVPKKTIFGNASARAAAADVVVCSVDSSSDGLSSPLLSVSSSSSATFKSFALIRPVNEKRYCVPDVVGSI